MPMKRPERSGPCGPSRSCGAVAGDGVPRPERGRERRSARRRVHRPARVPIRRAVRARRRPAAGGATMTTRASTSSRLGPCIGSLGMEFPLALGRNRRSMSRRGSIRAASTRRGRRTVSPAGDVPIPGARQLARASARRSGESLPSGRPAGGKTSRPATIARTRGLPMPKRLARALDPPPLTGQLAQLLARGRRGPSHPPGVAASEARTGPLRRDGLRIPIVASGGGGGTGSAPSPGEGPAPQQVADGVGVDLRNSRELAGGARRRGPGGGSRAWAPARRA